MTDPRFAVQDILSDPASRMHVNGSAPVEARPAWMRRAAGVIAVAGVALAAMAAPAQAASDEQRLQTSIQRLAQVSQPMAEDAMRLLDAYVGVSNQFISSGVLTNESLSKIVVLIDPACDNGKTRSFDSISRAKANVADNRFGNVIIGNPRAGDGGRAVNFSDSDESDRLSRSIFSLTAGGACDSALAFSPSVAKFAQFPSIVRLGKVSVTAESNPPVYDLVTGDLTGFDRFKIAHEVWHVVEPYVAESGGESHPFAKAIGREQAKIGRLDLVLSDGGRVPLNEAKFFRQGVERNWQRLAGIFSAPLEASSYTTHAEGYYLVDLAQEMTADVGALVIQDRIARSELGETAGREAAIAYAMKLAETRDAVERAQEQAFRHEAGFNQRQHNTGRAIRAFIDEARQDGFAGLSGEALTEKIRDVAARGWIGQVRANLQDKDHALLDLAAMASHADLSHRYVESIATPHPGAGALLKGLFIGAPKSPAPAIANAKPGTSGPSI